MFYFWFFCITFLHSMFRFVPPKVASQAITKSIRQKFLKPWPTWGVIPPEEKDHFWQHFKVTCHQTYSLFLTICVRVKCNFPLLFYLKYHTFHQNDLYLIHCYRWRFSGDLSMNLKLKKISMPKHLIGSLRCLEMLGL